MAILDTGGVGVGGMGFSGMVTSGFGMMGGGGGGEYDLMHLWEIITKLSEQLSQNRSQSVALYGRVEELKSRALDAQMGFVLRRNNLHLSNEEYESELERMNTSMTAENQSLQHDNKQLNTLIKEYEQTLETLMSTFRNRAQDVQEHELSLIREYERRLLNHEEINATRELSSNTGISESVARLSQALRQLIRAQGGEEAEQELMTEEDEREPWMAAVASEQALEREIELARLEKENEELRRMLNLPVSTHAEDQQEQRHQQQSQPYRDQQHLQQVGPPQYQTMQQFHQPIPPPPQITRENSMEGGVGIARHMYEMPSLASMRQNFGGSAGGVVGIGPFGTFKRARQSSG